MNDNNNNNRAAFFLVVVFLFFAKKNVFVLNFQKREHERVMMISFASASSLHEASFREKGSIKENTQKHLFLLLLLLLSSNATKNSFRGALVKALVFFSRGFEVIFFPLDERREK
jgi:hypothetical protein